MHGVQPLTAESVLETYARRGVFRSLHVSAAASGRTYRFHWLWNAAFTLRMETGAIVFPSLLPGMERGSDLENGVCAFLAECASAERPAHRRLDPGALAVTYSNRGGRGQLRFRIRGLEEDAAVRQAIGVVNELFVSHLSTHHPTYLTEHFHAPED